MSLWFWEPQFGKQQSEILEVYNRLLPLIKPVEGRIIVTFSKRLVSTAGTASFSPSYRITLSEKLMRENPEELIPTFIHELAHILVRDQYGSKVKSHGPEWKVMMKLLGQEPERCHTMKIVSTGMSLNELMQNRKPWRTRFISSLADRNYFCPIQYNSKTGKWWGYHGRSHHKDKHINIACRNGDNPIWQIYQEDVAVLPHWHPVTRHFGRLSYAPKEETEALSVRQEQADPTVVARSSH